MVTTKRFYFISPLLSKEVGKMKRIISSLVLTAIAVTSLTTTSVHASPVNINQANYEQTIQQIQGMKTEGLVKPLV